ncbi:TIGR03086 family metal-binding protein [Aeromicrobium ginsengisoli]|uniref:TIGR03086 family protein n=1 Tax=Aeromicrobium ginsengisoli TaxID=363867 RepID=A0A5M4FI13_9ACTN|nr:TIGR03086 family metal-binding protein [Aeromicrobium ginsengisoli]KAA1399373.1 TIGR03086 family protein [Aeromicrobium ginsengisoli]
MTARDIDLLETVLITTLQVADGLTTQDLERPTPCDEFNVRLLLEHVIGWQQVTAACAADREAPVLDGSPTYRASSDLGGDLRAASATLVTNLRARHAETITMPYRGETPMRVMLAELIAETVIHTWDLAVARGQAVDFDADVVSAAHDGLTLLLGESFAEMGFRVSAETPPSADDLVRLLVRSGRAPGVWRV